VAVAPIQIRTAWFDQNIVRIILVMSICRAAHFPIAMWQRYACEKQTKLRKAILIGNRDGSALAYLLGALTLLAWLLLDTWTQRNALVRHLGFSRTAFQSDTYRLLAFTALGGGIGAALGACARAASLETHGTVPRAKSPATEKFRQARGDCLRLLAGRSHPILGDSGPGMQRRPSPATRVAEKKTRRLDLS
jgi:hypothetical protein